MMCVLDVQCDNSILHIAAWQVAPFCWNYVECSLHLVYKENTKKVSVMFTNYSMLMSSSKKNGSTIPPCCNTSPYNHTWIMQWFFINNVWIITWWSQIIATLVIYCVCCLITYHQILHIESIFVNFIEHCFNERFQAW